MYKSVLILALFISSAVISQNALKVLSERDVTVGAACFNEYLPKLSRKNVAIVTNNSGLVGNTSIVDTLLRLKVNVKKIFGPEHGFRGTANAGEPVKSNIDKQTKLPIISLYGTHKKPTQEDLADIDVVIYDIQDVGVRFYTFISTLTYVMEACAESNKALVVLDRPNPNGFYVDGPTMTDRYKGFMGVHNVPLVYGMSSGEYAKMVNGEGWLPNKGKCNLTVIPVKGYEHNCTYDLPVKPSPNLPDLNSVLLYPSLGLFEGTVMSVGRGTDMPFEVIGHPKYSVKAFSFVPKPNTGDKDPKYKYEVCYGVDLRKEQQVQDPKKHIQLQWLMLFHKNLKDSAFFNGYFNYHSGNTQLQTDIRQGKSEEEIRESWKDDITLFKAIRKKYLLYKDFE